MIVAQITELQANELKVTQFIQDNYFNPVQDANGNWFISLEELKYCSVEFCSTTTLIEYNPVIIEMP